ncbi:MAG: MBL fold metallo-hydrolase [Ignavibacteriales bacterium]|nr:MBL fold metallo-hydrolase [Ignavibacteriales bacterium]
MKRIALITALLLAVVALPLLGQPKYESDTLKSAEGNIIISFLGHGSVMFGFKSMVIYIDPVSRYADFATMPKADLILVTHEHGDHLDSAAIEGLRSDKTKILCTEACLPKVRGGSVMKNGETQTISGIKVEAVPAYNIVHMRSEGVPYHAKGAGSGYILTFGGKRIYTAGDTENIPEMSKLGTIDVAFLPMNLPYTMTPEMVAEAAKRMQPKILYPYHFGKTDTALLMNLLKDEKGIEIRIRKMQ